MAIILRRRKLGRTSCKEIAALSKTGIVAVRNDQAFPEGHNLVFRWGTTSNLPYKATVVNEAKAIHWVADKAASRFAMAEQGLSPKTWLSYKSFNEEDYDDNWPDQTPVVLRKRNHAQGRDLFYFDMDKPNAFGNLEAKCYELGEDNYYISAFVDKKSEFRVFVVSGRVACVAKKTPSDPSAIAWNVAQGGRFDNVRWGEWPIEAIRVAIEAFKLSGLDFGGVDVMVDAEGKAYVLEINSAPSLTSPYRQECMAKCFDYIVENGKSHIETGDEGTWRAYVHPAVAKKD